VKKVCVEDVDGHFARGKAEGARTVSEPQDGFRGGRIDPAPDHEGHPREIARFRRETGA